MLASGAVTSNQISDGGKALISLADTDAGLIGENSSGLINQDGNGIINQDGNGIINQDGNGLINQDGNGLLTENGNNVVSNDGGSLIGENSSGVIGENSSGIVPAGASSFTSQYTLESLDAQAATNDARPLSVPTKKIGTEIAAGETEPDGTDEINPAIAALSTGSVRHCLVGQ